MATLATGSRHSMSFTPESTFGTTPTAVLRNEAGIDAATVDDSYNDAGVGLAVFKAGDIIRVSGFTDAANNGIKHVVSAVAAKMIVEENLVLEAAGDDVTIEIAFPRLRHKGTTLMLTKDTFTSEELRNDRQIIDLRHGNKQIGGDVTAELGAVAFDDLIEAALQGTWSALTPGILKAGTTMRSFSISRLFDDLASLLLYDGVMVNTLSVSAQLNGMIEATFGLLGQGVSSPTHVITVLPGGVIEIGDVFSIDDQDGNELVTYTAAAATVADVVAGLVSVWNTSTNPICILYTAADVATTHLTLTGDTAGTWYDLTPNAVEGGVADTQTMILTHSPVRPAGSIESNDPFDSFTGEIKEAGGAVATIQGFDFVIDNGLTPAHVLMDSEVVQFVNGRSNITGTVTAYFDSLTLYNKFVLETPTILEIEFEDPDANKLEFLFPNVKYTSGDVPVDGEGPIIVTLGFQALYDTTELRT